MRFLLTLILILMSGNAFAGFKVSSGDLLVPAGNVGVGSSTPRAKVDVDGAVYATTYYGSGANLTNLPASMTYPNGDGVAVVSGSSSWGTTLSTDGSGDCGTGAVCLGDHTHSSYLTAVASDSDWTVHGSYPAACSAGQYVSAIGDTNTCGTPTDTNTTYTATADQGLLLTSSTQFGIQDCAANQVMKRNAGDTAWECATDATGAGGGYTNLTEFVDQGNWKVFYSDGSGDVKELTTGAYGYALMGQGTTSAPAFVDMAIYALDSDLTGYVPTSRTVNGQALSGDVTVTTISGLAGTATALAANGTNCDSGYYPKGVDASGNAETCILIDSTVYETADATILKNDEIDASSELIAIMDDEVGTGYLVFNASPTFTGNVGIGAAAGAKLGVDGAIYAGSGTPSPTWSGVSMASAGDAYFMGDLEVDGTIYTDATGDSFLNVTGGNVGIGTSTAGALLVVGSAGTISGTLAAGSAHIKGDIEVDGSIYIMGSIQVDSSIYAGVSRVGVTFNATTTCGCKTYVDGICVVLGTCS